MSAKTSSEVGHDNDDVDDDARDDDNDDTPAMTTTAVTTRATRYPADSSAGAPEGPENISSAETDDGDCAPSGGAQVANNAWPKQKRRLDQWSVRENKKLRF